MHHKVVVGCSEGDPRMESEGRGWSHQKGKASGRTPNRPCQHLSVAGNSFFPLYR